MKKPINPPRLPANWQPKSRKPKSASVAHSPTLQEVRRIREEMRQQKKMTREWAEQNKDFDVAPYVKKWTDNREEFKEQFVDLVVDVMSAADGIAEANNVIKFGMDMSQASIDPDSITQLLEKLFRVQALNILLGKASLTTEQKEEIVNRSIAREFPLRDNKPDAQQPRQVMIERSTPMERMAIRRQAESKRVRPATHERNPTDSDTE